MQRSQANHYTTSNKRVNLYVMVYLRILVTAQVCPVWTRFSITRYCIHHIAMTLVKHGSTTERRKNNEHTLTSWHGKAFGVIGPLFMIPFTGQWWWYHSQLENLKRHGKPEKMLNKQSCQRIEMSWRQFDVTQSDVIYINHTNELAWIWRESWL